MYRYTIRRKITIFITIMIWQSYPTFVINRMNKSNSQSKAGNTFIPSAPSEAKQELRSSQDWYLLFTSLQGIENPLSMNLADNPPTRMAGRHQEPAFDNPKATYNILLLSFKQTKRARLCNKLLLLMSNLQI